VIHEILDALRDDGPQREIGDRELVEALLATAHVQSMQDRATELRRRFRILAR
jgi:hypothetical protein